MKTPAIIAQVEDYLVSRRAMGFDLRGEGYQLRAFARFAGEQADAETLTLELLLRWVQGSVAPGPVTAARREQLAVPAMTISISPVAPITQAASRRTIRSALTATFRKARRLSMPPSWVPIRWNSIRRKHFRPIRTR